METIYNYFSYQVDDCDYNCFESSVNSSKTYFIFFDENGNTQYDERCC